MGKFQINLISLAEGRWSLAGVEGFTWPRIAGIFYHGLQLIARITQIRCFTFVLQHSLLVIALPRIARIFTFTLQLSIPRWLKTRRGLHVQW